jgi:pimeloyl-ACP methyl ester carboxylesterase
MNVARSASDHITPYDRLALDEPVLISLLAAPVPNDGLVEYFGAELHAELARLARLTIEHPPGPRARRVYVLPGIMGSQLGIARDGGRPNDILWLDPIDFQLGRLTDLKFEPGSGIVAFGAMNYTYLKLTLSLRAAGFDALLLDYDWRRDIATLGRELADRISADARENVALIGHSMGGLVARGALMHAAGSRVSRVIMLGTPNSGSFGAVQALRGTYSVVRKLAQLDLRHDAEYLAREVFSSFPGLHELLPGRPALETPDLFDTATWPADGQGPNASLLHAAKGLGTRIAPGDARFHVVIGCNQPTATGIARQAAGFEYEYSRQGDGTVPIALARLNGAAHGYIECDHSDLPLDDRVIAGTIELLGAGATQRFATAPPATSGLAARVCDAELRQLHRGKIDWPHMTAAERRRFLDTLNEPPQSALGLG